VRELETLYSKREHKGHVANSIHIQSLFCTLALVVIIQNIHYML